MTAAENLRAIKKTRDAGSMGEGVRIKNVGTKDGVTKIFQASTKDYF